ncbi:MAG: flagellar biosynthesis protein FlhF [Planctomycetota bacterium]
MPLKVYRARSMNDALAEVKRDLGADAVILHTRNTKAGGLFGIGARTIVEITATTDDNPPTRRPPTPARGARPSPRMIPRTGPAESALDAPGNPPVLASAPREIPAADPLAALLANAAEPIGQRHESPGRSADRPAATQTNASGPVAVSVPRPSPPARTMPVRNGRPAHAMTPSTPAHEPGSADDIQSIKRMLARLLQSSTAAGSSTGRTAHAGSMSDPLFEHYLRLQEHAVATEIADDIVGRVRDELSAAELADPDIVRETVLRHIASILPIADEPASSKRPADGRPRIVALVGPTGVGKTTTLAKLAATAKLRRGRSVGLITTDTYRIAAVEQLRTYADIIGLELRVVSTPADMRPALESLADADEILIDTAGRSQHDTERLTELRAFLDQADPHETHLVLSSIAAQPVLERAVDNFAPLRPNRLIITKLDEAVNFGVILSVTKRLNVQLSYVTTGQEVPDHIEPGKPDRLARMILTGEHHA